MDITDEERAALGRAAAGPFRRLFHRNKRAAYNAAKVSPATLDKFFTGESVRDDKLQALIDTFWPDADGDWRVVLADSVGGSPEDAYVAAPGATTETGVTNEQLLAEIRLVRSEYRDISERVARLEKQGSKSVGRTGGKT